MQNQSHMSTKRNSATTMKSYIVERNKETLRVTVPESWKVTYGPIFRGDKNQARYDSGGLRYALRFYESDNKQRALFCDVQSFRDASIKIEKKIVTVEGKSEFRANDKSKSSKEEQAVSEEWNALEV